MGGEIGIMDGPTEESTRNRVSMLHNIPEVRRGPMLSIYLLKQGTVQSKSPSIWERCKAWCGTSRKPSSMLEGGGGVIMKPWQQSATATATQFWGSQPLLTTHHKHRPSSVISLGPLI